MKLSLQLFFLGAVSVSVPVAAADSSVTVTSSQKYVPARISFEDLANGIGNGSGENDIFWKTLREVGLLSITDIPNFQKQSMLTDLEDCLHHQTVSVGAPDFDLQQADHGSGKGKGGQGRRRRTLATRTLAGAPEGILVATLSGTKKEGNKEEKQKQEQECFELQASSQTFRAAVQAVSEAIAARFGEVERFSFARKANGDRRIPVETLINEGEHLEHFHSYYSDHESEAEGEDKASSTNTNTDKNTIDWHTDQGMMLLFTPGQRQDGTVPSGFFIELKDGSTAEVAFDSHVDDLVIMLGDGVNQYINNDNGNDGNSNSNLRAVPHALALPSGSSATDTSSDSPRLWYGRMVLPPPEAVHPSGHTFQDLRTSMIRGDTAALSLGCASSSMVARELMEDMFHGDDAGEDELQCDEDTSMLCWMRCMNYTDFDTTPDDCASESESDEHTLGCYSEGGGVWKSGVHSADYSLRCLARSMLTDGDTEGGGMDMDMDHSGMDHDGMDHSSMNKDDSAAVNAAVFASGTMLGLFGMMLAMMM